MIRISEPRGPRYSCSNCKHIWIPRGVKPGDVVNCPKCGAFHSKRAEFLKPPKPSVYVPRGQPVKKTRARQLNPHRPRELELKDLSGRVIGYKKEGRRKK